MAHPFIQHLLEDHETQRRLGEQLKNATDEKEREALRKEMYEELYPHMKGEEASIFSYMQKAGDEPKEMALEAIQEHHVGKLLMREMLQMAAGGDVFKAKVSVLDEMNRHHMEEEEGEHFPWLEKNVSAEELSSLFEDYEKAEEQAKKS